MAYIKTDWQDGDVISEAGLDHLETGVYNNSVAIGDLSELDTTAKANLVAAINEVAQSGGGGGGLSNAVKDALLQIAAKVAYIDEDGQEYYDDLYDALYPGATIVSINADYTQTGTVYPTTSLDDLRNDLVVNAIYDNGSVVPVISYTLSGTLEEGTSTITVTYEGLTDTFDVEVTAAPTLSSISAVYTQSGTVYDTDSLDSLKADLVVTATYSDSSTATVPSADYTLSGTLTVGTSTITVSYQSKTTTFNVTVSSEYPLNYTWLYKSSDNVLLSNETEIVSQTLRNGSPTEAIQDGYLHLVAEGTTGAYVQYNLIPNANTNAVLEAKVKCNSLPRFVNLACGFFVMVSNGSTGARLSVDSGGFRYSQGTAYTKVDFPSGFDYTDWHRYKIELTSDGKQIGYVDGTKLFEVATLSSSYATVTRIGIVKNDSINTFNVDIEWIAFLDRSSS